MLMLKYQLKANARDVENADVQNWLTTGEYTLDIATTLTRVSNL
jgi:hypothetical protein